MIDTEGLTFQEGMDLLVNSIQKNRNMIGEQLKQIDGIIAVIKLQAEQIELLSARIEMLKLSQNEL